MQRRTLPRASAASRTRDFFGSRWVQGPWRVMKHWGENPGWGHRYTLPTHKGDTEGQCHTKRHVSASFLRQPPDKGGILKTSQAPKVRLELRLRDKACRSCAQPPRDC